MPLVISTQSYRGDHATEYGLLVELDESAGKICRTLRIDTPVNLPNGAGRIKPGLRGISCYKENLYVATWNSIVVINRDTFEQTGEISHHWMSDLHGLCVNEDGIWVTSTRPDAVILYDFDGDPIRAVWFSETAAYPEFKPVDKGLDWRLIGKGVRPFHHFHCNHVEVCEDYVYVTGRGGKTKNGRIYRFNRSQFHLESRDIGCHPKLVIQGLFGPHDGLHHAGSIWVTETSNSSIAEIGVNGTVERRIRLKTEEENGYFIGLFDNAISKFKNFLGKPGSRLSHWTRGLAATDRFLYVGQSTLAGSDESTARVLIISIETGAVENIIPIDIDSYPEARIFQVLKYDRNLK